jgi:hypothetical protein
MLTHIYLQHLNSVVMFFLKAILIEWAIELCRFTIFYAWNKMFPKEIFLSHSNRYFSWFINVLESLCVMVLLYLKYDICLIILFTLLLTFIIKNLGSLIISKYF